MDSWLWDLPDGQFKVAITLLMMANWKEGSTFSRGKLVKVARGQVMTSLPKLAERSKVSIKTVRTSLKNLQSAEFLADEAAGGYRIITILNYDENQLAGKDQGQPERQDSGSQGAGQRQDSGRTAAPIEEGNKGRRGEGERERHAPADTHRALAHELWQEQQQVRSELGLSTLGLMPPAEVGAEILSRIEDQAKGHDLTHAAAQCRYVLQVVASEVREDQAKAMYLDGRMWTAQRFTTSLASTPRKRKPQPPKLVEL